MFSGMVTMLAVCGVEGFGALIQANLAFDEGGSCEKWSSGRPSEDDRESFVTLRSELVHFL
jgi:hypothetical protein